MISDLLDKITSYNLFNHLLPGAVFAFFAEDFLDINLVPDDLITAAFLYYFLGIVISRFGSLAVERTLRKIGLVKFASYEAFVDASSKDSKIEVLVESANMYRTFVSAMVLLLLLGGYLRLEVYAPCLSEYRAALGGISLFAIFLFSYVKQSTFIADRVRNAAPLTPPSPPKSP